MVGQDYLLFPHLNVEGNLAFGLRYQNIAGELRCTRISATARLLGIDHLLHRFPYTLSGGERQHIAMGRTLITEPSVLLLDEPLSALDRYTARRLRAELAALHRTRNLTVVHITHNHSEARRLTRCVAVMKEGPLNDYGTLEEIMRRPPTLFAADFVASPKVFEASASLPSPIAGGPQSCCSCQII